MERAIRVLVAEDSRTTREYLISLLEHDAALSVIGDAGDGEQAVSATHRMRPDVVLMDLHMPRMDGYEATRRIMETAPTPVIIVSASLEPDHTAAAIEALKAGALAVVVKPPAPGQPGHAEAASTLIEQTKLMAEVKVVGRRATQAPRRPLVSPGSAHDVEIAAIGASTGGPAVLAQILGGLPRDLGCPVLIVQHIAPGFVGGLARVLDADTTLRVKTAEGDEPARPGTVYLAPDDCHMGITRSGRIELRRDPPRHRFRPSVSHLLESVARAFGPRAMGILLTGMSGDGADGLYALRHAGGLTIAQDEQTSVVFGMPMDAIRLGAAAHVLPPAGIVALLSTIARSGRRDPVA